MKEFEVTVRVRNNRLKERRDDLGMSQVQLCQKVGINPSTYSAIENMRQPPKTKNGEWTSVATALSEFHGVAPDELFPLAVQNVDKSVATRKVDAEDLGALTSAHHRKMALPPDELYEEHELRKEVLECLHELPPRAAGMIKMRFGLDGGEGATFRQIGKHFGGLSVERIRKIIEKGLRQLRCSGDPRETHDERTLKGGGQ